MKPIRYIIALFWYFVILIRRNLIDVFRPVQKQTKPMKFTRKKEWSGKIKVLTTEALKKEFRKTIDN